MDRFNQLTNGQKVIVISAVVMVVVSFLPWYSYDFGPISLDRNAWQSPGAIWSTLAVLVALGMGAVVLAVAFGNVKLPDLGQITWGQAALGGGALTVLLLIIKFLNHSGDLGIGFIIGFVAAIGLAAGGYLRYTEEGAGGVRKA